METLNFTLENLVFDSCTDDLVFRSVVVRDSFSEYREFYRELLKVGYVYDYLLKSFRRRVSSRFVEFFIIRYNEVPTIL